MVSFTSFEPDMQVNGATIHSVLSVLKMQFLVDTIFTKAGLPLPKDIKAEIDAWYSQQGWLNAFKVISEKVGSATLFSIGKTIPENAVFPPEIKEITDALQSIDVAFHMNHRNSKGEVLFDPTRPADKVMLEGIGHYEYLPSTQEKQAIIVCKNPYPCDFDRGIITTMAQRFESGSTVRHDDLKPCRKHGAESCTFIVNW